MPKPKRSKMVKVDTQSIIGSKISFKEKGFKFSEKQQKVLSCLLDEKTKIVFLTGPAGSAKTFLAIYAALQILDGDFSKDIIYIRSLIESASKSLGYLPGMAEEKFSPYTIPLLEKCDEIIESHSTDELMTSSKISSMPINFLRGVSWKNKIVCVDECQNLTLKEKTTLLTRVGEKTKVFLMGDFSQSDINGRSGFQDIVTAFTGEDCEDKGIFVFNFGVEDIFRSEILKFIIQKIESIPQKH